MTTAVILSAGQGRRLLPLTATMPKCLLPIHERTLLEWQLDALARCGVPRATVVTGFASDQVERLVAGRTAPPRTQLLYNPFFRVSDNLVSCWIARGEMTGDFLLVNGDTLFEPAVLERLLAAPSRPVRLAAGLQRAARWRRRPASTWMESWRRMSWIAWGPATAASARRTARTSGSSAPSRTILRPWGSSTIDMGVSCTASHSQC